MAAFSDFKVPEGRIESGLMGGIKEKKNQGKRLGLIREFLCEINRLSLAAGSGCGTCRVNCNWTLSPKTVVCAWPASHVQSPSVTSWPCKQNYSTAFIFLETIIPHTAKSVWSPPFCKQCDRRRRRQRWRENKIVLLLYGRLSFRSESRLRLNGGQITESCCQMPVIHDVLGSSQTRCTPRY